MKIDGGCHCGKITYTAEIDPERTSICHCTDCQTLTGTAFRTVVPAASSGFHLTGGPPKIYIKTAESGSKRVQGFCPECGTPIYSSAVTDAQVYMVRVGSIRQRAQLRPSAQFWCRSALPWTMEQGAIAGIPKHQMGA